MTASWHDHVIWWHVYPLGALGAPIREGHDEAHRLPRLVGWLDYLVDLGANGLQLGPVFASTSHGYDTTDFSRIDPRLGDAADLEELVGECHTRGIKVMLDGVFNHVGVQHPLYQQALAEGPSSDAARLFRIDWSDPEHPVPALFEGHGGLVALNHEAQEVADLVAEVMLTWLRRGIDGWRLDAAYAVDPHFWARVLPQVRAEFPEALFVGEMIHGDYAAYVAASGLDSVTEYELWKSSWSSIESRNFFELAWTLKRHNDFQQTFCPMTFVGNHDVTRIASRVGDAGAALALVVLGTVGGMPSLYYGDEQAFRGVKTEGWSGDDEVRPALPASPAELSPAGAWMYALHRQVLGLRRRHPWLVHARTEDVLLENERYAYDAVGPGGERLRVELALGDVPSARVLEGDEVLLAYP